MNRGKTFRLKPRDMEAVWRVVLLLCCYDCESTERHYDDMQFESVLFWILIIKLESPKGDSYTIGCYTIGF